MKTFLLFTLFLFSLIVQAQTITPEQRKDANNYFLANDWINTIKSYQLIAKAEPQNWNARMRWGIGLTNTGKVKEALPLLEEAVTIGKNAPTMYYLSSAYAKDGNKEKAFEWLDQSIKNGLGMLTAFELDINFNSLKTDSRYQAMHEQLKRNVNPCQYLPEARQFDFWIGEWDAVAATGQSAGKSRIERMLGDCVIFENWTSAPPNLYAGKSFNLYNSLTKKWMQTWVDDKGGVIEFINGEYKDNVMTFITLPDAQKQITRLTFHNLNPNLVRQHFEVTSDDGKTWTTTTDLYYHRVK
jgi:tetratricopeptide (TPR) repeat protein